MKKLNSRILSAFLALLLVFSLLPGISFTADAVTVDYQYGSTAAYSKVIKNWGIRGELATFLSPNAEDFYKDTTYEELSALDGSSDLTLVNTSALYVALYNLMKDAHTTKNSYDESKYLFQYTDCQNNGSVASGKISTFYSGTLAGPEWDKGSTFTREHTWPDSMGGSAETAESARTNETDIMMLRPVPQSENSSRSNTPYGESSGYYYPNKGSYDVRGDAARTILYVYVRWGNEQAEVLANLWNVFESKDVLLSWIQADPVDTWEMGRNDSVQSITGTRNVFVDYPELAFALFKDEVPADYDTPSGSSSTTNYEITAVSNNTAYGTVSVNGRNITAYPASGYQVAGYQITSGTATVTQNGNVFTVKTTEDCTIKINFALAPKYTVQIKENGRLKLSQSVQANTDFTLPAFSSSLPENHTFLGWSAAEVSETGQKPAVYAAGEKVSISANITFYAVVAVLDPTVVGGTKIWTLVTDNSQIAVGDEVIIAAKDYDYAMSTEQKSNNRGQTAVTKNGTVLTFEDSVGVQVFTLASGNISGSYAFNTGSGYLYVYNNSNNYLRTQSSLDDKASFYISVGSDGTCSITSAAYVSGTSGVGNVPMQYNQKDSLFSCYPKATQKALSLYVAVASNGATTFTSSWSGGAESCSHSNTTTATVPATCTADGSVTVTCNACGEVVSTTVLPAADHGEEEKEIPATLTQQGYTLLYCDVCGEELGKENYSDPLTDVAGWSLTLGSDLSINFKLDVDESIRSTAQIHIAVANDAKTYPVSALTVHDDGYYYLSVKLAAAQMTETVTVQITNGNDQTEKMPYSVKSYAEVILAGSYSNEMKALVTQMLHYGAAAQTYFNYKLNDLANAGLEAPTQSTPQTSNVYKLTGKVDGIDFYGATMMFRDKIAVRCYFTVTGDISTYSFTANGNTCTPVQKGDQYYIEIGNINPQDLDDVITVKVNNTLTVTYSPMNYIVNMGQKGSDNLKLLVQALYDYHLAAKAYTNSN